jgi:hypothetical protein
MHQPPEPAEIGIPGQYTSAHNREDIAYENE